ncbi:Werner syndrome ATP-dependent helicase homolog isoform X1 [Anguilla anguilla]|uniref:Werner syndrome ATP-dependent helicase homolog isoform X1 n=1 Tax=Anguilla anguilla TaxID=7936 RepID=UPI0015AC4A88|nr:Werner syndrome ATP-dependent helicase homolog isoform X1 [Anguilla anguilla]XP_035247570.1 Werner syndrome ATP-dependent helicase homolog isoform X1 [Anguilla anguilla]
MTDRTLPEWMSIDSNSETIEKKGQQGFLKKNILEDDLPFLEFPGTVMYSREKNDCSFLSEDLRSCLEPGAAVGFDIEWPPSFAKGKTKKVAMVQLCASEEKCYLFHLSSMSGFPAGLKMLLQDESIKKVGVGIEGDMWKLLSDFDIKLKNFVELSNLANETLRCVEQWSLDGLVKHLFKRRLRKDKDVRCSQWDDFELTEDQKRYAATDAYAGLIIHKKLQDMVPGTSLHTAVKEKLLQMASEMKELAGRVPEGVHINSAVELVEEMTVNLETLRSLLLGNNVEGYTTDAADIPDQGPLEEKEKAEAPSGEEVMFSHCTKKVSVNKLESEDVERSSDDLLGAPENSCDPVERVRAPEDCTSARQDGAWMSLDISEYELQMLERQAMQEELEEQSTLEFQDKKPLDDSSDLSYVVESDEELENEMLQCVEEVEKMSQDEKGLCRGEPERQQTTVDDDEDDEDEGIEEEEVEEFDPSLPEPTPEQINCLKTYFGHFRFKPVQWKVIYSVLKERRDNLVVMATGYGKSLCFQFPPVYCGGISVVVCPLISLMEDQVLQLKMSNIPACFLGSAQTSNIIPDLKKGLFRVAYMTPEFCSGRIALLEELNESIGLTLVAIDEAHCISEWGHDFRGAYRNLGLLKTRLPDVPIVALTATASPSIRVDIVQSLRLVQPVVTCTTFDRPNLYLDVHRKSGDLTQDLKQFLVKKSMGDYEFEGPTIVYCPSRKEAERVSSMLCRLGILCGVYHAGLGIKKRRETQHSFMRDEIQCIAATVAFGMGINKPDIRKVIHYGAPKEMESYYQEIGRAGRDGLPSACHVLWAGGDMSLNKFLLNQGKNDHFRGYKMKMLAKMEQYLKSPKCRRKLILSHFEDKQLRKVTSGIMGTNECCDNCRYRMVKSLSVEEPEPRLQNFGNEAYQLMSAISALDERFGVSVPILFLRGSSSQRVPDRYRRSPLFGAGRSVSEAWWKALAQQLLMEDLLKESTGHSRFSTLCKITPKGMRWLCSAEDETQRTLLLQPSADLCARVSVPARSHTPSAASGFPVSQAVVPVQRPQLDKYTRPESRKYVRSADASSARPQPTSSLKPQTSRPAARPPPPAVSPRELELQVELYGKLVAGRQKLASEKDIPPAILATNKILLDMAKIRPCTQASLKVVDGVSEAKSKMLEPLLGIINEFCRRHRLQADASPKAADPRPSVPGLTEATFASSLGSAAITYRLFQQEGKSLRLVSDSRSLPLAVVESHLLQARRANLPLDMERAGLTPPIRHAITSAIKGHAVSSDFSGIKAVRALVPEHISTFLVQLTVMELERAGVPSTSPVAPSSAHQSQPAVSQQEELAWIEPEDKPVRRDAQPAFSLKKQTSRDSDRIEMMEDQLFSPIPMPKRFGIKASTAPCSSEAGIATKPSVHASGIELVSSTKQLVTDTRSGLRSSTSQAGIKASAAPCSSEVVPAAMPCAVAPASWNEDELDQDTKNLFSVSPPQSVNQPVKRKLPEWAVLPRGSVSSSTSTGSKKAKKKKGLFL